MAWHCYKLLIGYLNWIKSSLAQFLHSTGQHFSRVITWFALSSPQDIPQKKLNIPIHTQKFDTSVEETGGSAPAHRIRTQCRRLYLNSTSTSSMSASSLPCSTWVAHGRQDLYGVQVGLMHIYIYTHLSFIMSSQENWTQVLKLGDGYGF